MFGAQWMFGHCRSFRQRRKRFFSCDPYKGRISMFCHGRKVPFSAVKFQSIPIKIWIFILGSFCQVSRNCSAPSAHRCLIAILQPEFDRGVRISFCCKSVGLSNTSLCPVFSCFPDCNVIFHPRCHTSVKTDHSYEASSIGLW